MTEKILVVGATGYIASKLIPLLLADGNEVRCLARTPEKLRRRPWYSQVEVVQADVNQAETILPALQGITTAYYLVHSMSAGQNYHQLDTQAATNFSLAAATANVRRIVYLGGLANPEDNDLAMHLSSRIQTGDCLRRSGIPVIEFRVGVVVGAGSVSFEMIRFIAEQFPLMVGPLWLRHKTQPVSVINVLQYLLNVVRSDLNENMIVDIGSKKQQTYIQIMTRYAEIRKLIGAPLLLPFIPVELMAFFIDKLTPVEYTYALPLVEGLKNDSLVQFTQYHPLFKHIDIIEYDQAVELALQETTLEQVDRPWLDKNNQTTFCFHSGLAVCFHRRSTKPERAFSVASAKDRCDALIEQLGISAVKIETQTITTYRITGELPKKGKVWLEWHLHTNEAGAFLEQTAALRPEGFFAFLYLYLNARRIERHLSSAIESMVG